jgi:raffinose/stachyose/melibiose transport system permease protein
MNRYTKLTLIRETGMWIVAVFMLLPFYLLINTSLKNKADAIGTPAYEPAKHPTLGSFAEVTQGDGAKTLFEGLFNSLFITAFAVLGLVAVGSITAYVFARRLNRLSNVTFYALLVGIVVPSQLGLVPIYIGARNLGLVGKTWGLGVLYIALFLPLAIFLYAGFVRNLPTEYEQAAFIDGASRTRVFMTIVFPLLSPATGTVAIMTGIIIWNDFFTPLIFLAGSGNETIPVAVFNYVGSIITNWNNIFAILIIALLPVTVLFLILQKKFIQGFSGGIKS